jgi:hypothetical protein
MMVAGRKRLKWKMPVKGAGEGSFTDLVELSILRQTEGMENVHLLLWRFVYCFTILHSACLYSKTVIKHSFGHMCTQ